MIHFRAFYSMIPLRLQGGEVYVHFLHAVFGTKPMTYRYVRQEKCMDRIVKPQSELREMCQKILTGLGVPQADAQQAVDVLMDAELCGVESHGLTRLTTYADRIALGLIEADPAIKIEARGAVARMDAGNGLGQVIMPKAADACIGLAKEYGIGMISVCNSNHFGAAGYFARRIAAQGCIGIVTSMAGPSMAPYGGTELLLGTNPIAYAFPAKDQVFCADMATSASSKGRIRVHAETGRDIPVGWALDRNGQDTTDAKEALRGIMLPMSGYKGYALALAVEAACSLLSGAALSYESSTIFDYTRTTNTGHSLLAVDIAHFLPLEEFEERAQQWFGRLKDGSPRPGFEIMIPGERAAGRKAANGDFVSILPNTMEALEESYRKYGI